MKALVLFSLALRFLHQPDLGPDSIVFVHRDDLWRAPVEGGTAERLTTVPGNKSFPRFSPDGSEIAFSSEVGGNIDVYLWSARSGEVRRLTYHPGRDLVQGFSPDGSRILFSSERLSDHFRPMLFTIGKAGGHPEPFAMHKAFLGSFSPDGKRLAYTPIRDAFRTWKRYRGGQTTPIWLVKLADYSHVEIPHENASDTSPLWLSDGLYFLSDRNDVMALFRFDEGAGKASEIHRNGEADIDAFSGRSGRLVYASEGYLFLYDVASGSARRLPITVPDDGEDLARRQQNVAEEIAAVALSPDGSRVAVEAHGEILVGPPFQNLTRSPGAADRSPAWSPDGRRIAFFTDASGEYELHVVDAEGAAPSARVSSTTGLGYQIRWSPDGGKLSFIDRFRKLHVLDLETGRESEVQGLVDPGDSYIWSPDGRYLAYPDLQSTLFRNLALHSVETGRSETLTDGIGDAHRPAFSPDGRTLYFLGSTNAGKAKTGLDLSVIAHMNDVSWSLYQVKLPEMRVFRLPLPAGNYRDLQAAEDGALLLHEDPSPSTFAGKPRIARFDPATGELTAMLPDVERFESKGRNVLYRSGESWAIFPGERKLDFSALEVGVDLAAEWRQIFLEAWRAQRDFFYDENLHGVDWAAMRDRYLSYLPDVRHRSDLDYVLRHLVGELVNSHISVSGPRGKEEPIPVGVLGADYEVEGDRYRVTRIVAGSYWDEKTSPLAAAGVEVNEGDFLLEVNGKELRHPTSLYSLFVDTVGKPVRLRVSPTARSEDSREVMVSPIDFESEAALRRRDWIERNRRKVDELSSGRIAYVYQPDTSEGSLQEFDRYFFPQSDRQAVLIDERFNDGGGDPDYQLDILDRQQVHWYRNRNEEPFKSPYYLIPGPKLMLVNAEAGSGGDVYPYQFKIRGLGKTVGTRTWGGVQGGGAGPRLIDGGFARVPNLGTWSPDGEYILENVGFVPDVEVQVHPKDDFEGRDPQLERAVEMLLAELERNPPPRVPSLETVDRSLKKSPR